MSKKCDKNQFTFLIIASIIAFAIILISSFLITHAVLENKFNIKNTVSNDSLPSLNSEFNNSKNSIDNNYSSTNKDESAFQSKEMLQLNKMAIEFLNYTSFQLLDELKIDYSTYGYIDGGYTIYNHDVFPHMQFVVATDGNEGDTIIDEQLNAVIATAEGEVIKDVFVGMTFEEIKNVVGDVIEFVGTTENDSLSAIINNEKYKIIFKFDPTNGKSTQATILPK